MDHEYLKRPDETANEDSWNASRRSWARNVDTRDLSSLARARSSASDRAATEKGRHKASLSPGVDRLVDYRRYVPGFWALYGHALDRFYGGTCMAIVIPSRFADQGASATQSTKYEVLAGFFKDRVRPDDVLVDVGCGQGRAIVWWLHQGLRNRMVGLELDPEVAEETRHRLRKYPNVTIIAGDAVDNLPSDGTLFYLYNPFGPDVVERFKERLAAAPPRTDIGILYHNAIHLGVWQGDPLWSVTPIELGFDDHPNALITPAAPSCV